MKTTRLAVFLLVAATAAVAAWAFLFRRSTHDNPALGLISVEYRWGRPRSILVDANRDGKPDARGRLRPVGRAPSPHDLPAELWESTQCDGVFDLHAIFDPSGRLSLLEIDGDRDGRYERRLESAEALVFWRDLRRPPNCGAKIQL